MEPAYPLKLRLMAKKFRLYLKEGQNSRLDQSHPIELAAYGFFKWTRKSFFLMPIIILAMQLHLNNNYR